MTEEFKPKALLADCANCPLKDEPCVPTVGPKDSKVAFVSRSPGKYDVRAGYPFANPRGSRAVLDHLLERHSVSRSSVLLTNVVLCHSENPPKEAIKACSLRLEAEIANCELVIAGGGEAVDVLTKYKGVAKSRGFSISRTNNINGRKQRVVVTNNPAAVVRDSDKYPDMVQDFKRAFDPLPPPIFPKVTIVESTSDIQLVLKKWLDTEFGILASDLEWRGTEIACAGFSQDPTKAAVLAGKGLYERRTRKLLRDFYERTEIKFVWHNGKSDTKVLRQNDIRGRIDEDTHLQSYDLDERPGYHTLEYLLSEHFGWPDYEPESVKHFKKTGEFLEPRRKSEYELYKYNGMDTAGTLMLHNKLRPQVDEEHYNHLLRAARAFRQVEMNGFHYDDVEACNINEREVYYRLWDLEEKLRNISGHPLLNPNSWQQVGAVWYDEWKFKHNLRDSGKKKFARSTAKEVREEITAGRFTCHPKFRDKLIEFNEEYIHYKKIKTMQSNFIEGLVKKVEKDGKLYTNFNVGGTVTGRPSSSDPNFNNIMREGYETIPGIRTLFLPSPGNVIVAGDLSQAELRTCAKIGKVDGLLSIYRDSNRSLHKERAAAFYGEGYTKEEYVKAKNINFGVTYGQGAAAFAQMYHMPRREAQEYIDSWWREFPELLKWTEEVGNEAITKGIVRSPFGHRRRFHLITDENIGDVKRESVSSIAQNVAAWITICAVIDLADAGVRVVATVYDSIVADVAASEAMEVAKLMKETMEIQSIKQLGWAREDIPFLADVSIGENWGNLKEVVIDEQQIAA